MASFPVILKICSVDKLIVLAVEVNCWPVIVIKFSDVVVIEPKEVEINSPVISIKLALPTLILFTSTFASKVGVFIVIDPPATTAKVFTVAVTKSSPVIVTFAWATILLTLFKDKAICSPVIEVWAAEATVTLFNEEVNPWPSSTKTVPLPATILPRGWFHAP